MGFASIARRAEILPTARRVGTSATIPASRWHQYCSRVALHRSLLCQRRQHAVRARLRDHELAPGFKQEFGKLLLREFVRVDNIFNREYIGSVIVNESNGRYFEPSPGTTFIVGLSAAYRF